MKNLIVIKIGGAVLTDKKYSGSLRKGRINNIAAQIKAALSEKKQGLVLVLGAGRKVHATAKKYQLNLGAKTRRQIKGAIATHMQAKELQTTVCKIFLKYFNIVPLQTNNFFFANKFGEITIRNVEYIEELLKNNFIPVFYGDMVYQPSKNFIILSGDKIAILLSHVLKASKVIFATDVDGVYRNSKKIGNRNYLIKNINVKGLQAVLSNNVFFKAWDTTGELPGS